MHPLHFRLSPYILGLLLIISCFKSWGQEVNLSLGFSLTPEMTTGSLANKRSDPMDLLRNSRFTYKPEVNLKAGFLPWLGLETGIYQKDRGLGIKTPILDDFGNTIGHSNVTTHYTYLGFPLKVHLKWQDLYFSAGPSLEMLTGFATYHNGQVVPPSFRPTRNLEVALNCQFGWEAQVTPGIYGFVGIHVDAQWLRPLQPTEFRYASIGLTTGIRFVPPEMK